MNRFKAKGKLIIANTEITNTDIPGKTSNNKAEAKATDYIVETW